MTHKEKIGDCTLYLGNCRDIISDYPAVDALVTDPPYGICATSGWAGKHGDCKIEGDDNVSLRNYILDKCHPKQAIIFGSPRRPRPEDTLHVLIWDKGESVGMGNLKFPWKPNYEEIYILGNDFLSPRRDSSILRFMPHTPCKGTLMETDHPYQKPVDLMSYLIKRTRGFIFDPFMGSGTTGVACAQYGREFVGIELEEKYFNIACRRIEEAYQQADMFINRSEPFSNALHHPEYVSKFL